MTPNSSLLQWLSTFQLAGQPAVELKKDAYYNLADGYVCARILNQIIPLYFTDKWLEGIKPVAPDGSWRLRVSNLKRILQKIHDYDSDLSNSQFRLSAINPDVTVIAQNFDPDQISRLIQLILFCAITCDKKQDYIAKIRDLPTQVKQDIKEAIEEILVRNEHGQSKLNTSQDPTHSDVEAKSTSYKFNLSTSSQNALESPARDLGIPGSARRDSSQSDSNKRNESHPNISTQSYYSNSNQTVEEVRQKLNEALIIKDERAQACHELELKLKQLQLERDQLAHDNERLLSKVNLTHSRSLESRRKSQTNLDLNVSPVNQKSTTQSSKESKDEESQDLILAQNKRMQSEIHQLKEEMIRIETEKEDFRLKSNLLKEDLDRITMKQEELRNKADQAKRLQDELDEQKQITEKVISYETMVENLVKKNNDIKKELKSLEEKNLAHVQNMVRLEQENQQLAAIVSQVEIYRRQLADSQVKLSEETHRADQAEAELLRQSEKLTAVRKENEKLFEAINQLTRNNALNDGSNIPPSSNKAFESISLKDRPQSTQETAGFDEQPGGYAMNSINTPVIDLKERIARLEMENQLLEAKVSSKLESNKSVLSSLLEESKDKCKRLEIDNRQLRKKLMLLDSNLKDVAQYGGLQRPSTSGANVIQDSSSDSVQALIKRVEELQRSLYQREQELRDAETRYQRNLAKARGAVQALKSNQPVGGSLHPSGMSSASFNSNSFDEAHLLKQQLQDRENRLIELEREFLEFRKMKEVHERLILSAFYGLTTPIQRKNIEKRLERSTITSPPNTASSSINTFSGKHSH